MVVLLLLQIFYVTQTDSVRKMFSSFLAINMVVLFFIFPHAYSFVSPKTKKR